MIAAAAWAAALVLLVFGRTDIVQPQAQVWWLSLGGLALLLALMFPPVTRRVERAAARARSTTFSVIAAMAVLIATIGGGSGSLAALAIVPPLVLAARWFGVERALLAGVGLFTVLLLVDALIAGRPVAVQNNAITLVAVAAFVIVCSSERIRGDKDSGLGLSREVLPRSGADGVDADVAASDQDGWTPAERGSNNTRADAPAPDSAESPSADSRLFGLDASGGLPGSKHRDDDVDEGEPGGVVGAAVARMRERQGDFKPDHQLAPDLLSRRPTRGSRQWWRTGTDNRLIAEYLLDIRASTGADEAVVWILGEGDSVLRPLAACSSNDWAERSNADAKWMSVVRWSCESAAVLTGDLEGDGSFVTAPLRGPDRLLGVLCLRSREGFAEASEQLKIRATHHAGYLARVVGLVDAHQSSRVRNLALDNALDAVRRLQERATVDEPAGAICDSLLRVCGCDAAALVRWDSSRGEGAVESAAGSFDSMGQLVVESASIVGTTCQRGTPFRVGAAHEMLSRVSLIAGREQLTAIGAICVQPMKRHGEVIGALVAAWNRPTDMMRHTASGVEVLAAAAAHALDTAWRLEEAQSFARTDGLTGLYNRRFLDEQVTRVVAESNRYSDPTSLILLDLDHFKTINDTHGHATGDLVLKHVALILLDGIRTVDLCARYGGEELAILLPRTGITGAVELAERLRTMVEARPLVLPGGALPVTASFGVASYPSPAGSPAALFTCADSALYRAKDAGRNRVRSATRPG